MKTKDLIYTKRTELGLTMKQLADQIGVSEATISRWESGNIESMRLNKFNALCRSLRITPQEVLFEWDDVTDIEIIPDDPRERQIQRLTSYYKKLTDAGLDKVEKYIEDLNPKYFNEEDHNGKKI